MMQQRYPGGSRFMHGIVVMGICMASCGVAAPSSTDTTAVEKQAETPDTPDKKVTLSGQWFLAYAVKKTGDTYANEFKLKRGYTTLKRKFANGFSARVTQDIRVDKEGDGRGDIELRLKYGYLRYTSARSFPVVTRPYCEVGLVHCPWMDYEQKINHYRVQGAMFVDRFGVVRSADYGITVGALLGGTISEDYRQNVNAKYPGRYGSIAAGIYNGGGYSAIEENANKVVEGRLSLRPLPPLLPGLQLSYAGAYGKGNTTRAPDYYMHLGFISFEHPVVVLTGQVYTGYGNIKGTALLPDSTRARYQHGYSFFGELCLGVCPLDGFVRFDTFVTETSDTWHTRRYIGGIAYTFLNTCTWVLDVEYNEYGDDAKRPVTIAECAIEMKY